MVPSLRSAASLLALCAAACVPRAGAPSTTADQGVVATTVPMPDGFREVDLQLEGGGDFPEVQMAIRQRLGRSACFDVARSLDPALSGDVVFTFTFEPHGGSPTVKPTGGSLADTRAARDCAASLAPLDVSVRPAVAKYTVAIAATSASGAPTPEVLARVRASDLDIVSLEGAPPEIDVAALETELARCLTWKAADVWALATYRDGKVSIAKASEDGERSVMERECVQAKLARIAPKTGRGVLSFAASSVSAGTATEQPVPSPPVTPPPATASSSIGDPPRTAAASSWSRTAASTLEPEVIRRVIQQSFSRLRACYERLLATDPSATGRVITTLTIERDGSVSKAATTSSDFTNKAMLPCIEKAFATMSFPSNAKGPIKISYPIVFSPDDGGNASASAVPSKKARSLRDLHTNDLWTALRASRISVRVPPPELVPPGQLLLFARQNDGGVAVFRRVPKSGAGTCAKVQGDVALDVQAPSAECERLLDAALP